MQYCSSSQAKLQFDLQYVQTATPDRTLDRNGTSGLLSSYFVRLRDRTAAADDLVQAGWNSLRSAGTQDGEGRPSLFPAV